VARRTWLGDRAIKDRCTWGSRSRGNQSIN